MSIVEKALQKAQAKAEKTVQAAEVPAPPTEAGVPASGPGSTADVQRGSFSAEGGRIELNFPALRADGRLVAEGLAKQTEDEFRRVKWPLLNAILGREGVAPAKNNIVLVTSAIPGEGKTFSALNLALSIAREPDLQVLLVDGDVAQPALSTSLGLAARPGLTDLIADEGRSGRDFVCATSVDRLWVLPAGSRRDNSPELLSSDRMQRVMDDLAGRLSPGVVIFDSPPILATNEAQVLSRYAGQVLMVVRADFTEQRVVKEALGLLEKGKPVSGLLNRVEPSLVSRYFSHYYYGYGQGSGT